MASYTMIFEHFADKIIHNFFQILMPPARGRKGRIMSRILSGEIIAKA